MTSRVDISMRSKCVCYMIVQSWVVVEGKSDGGKWSVLVTWGIGMLALLDNEVGREKIHVIFGRRYHRLTGTQ